MTTTVGTKADDIALDLEELIVSGQIAPGSVLRQEQLSEQYQVSRTPIREALRRLAALGLVTFEANKGVRVRTLERDELREAMQKTLEQDGKDACFLFVLQRFVDQDKTPTEHTTVNWDLVAPMVPVADLKIPAQTFSSEAQDTFCDDMAFTPWHALPEHKPLGVVNRTRFVVYTATAKLRRGGNGVATPSAVTGPTRDESF